MSIRPPVCLIQNPKLVCIRFIVWARSVCCLLVHLFLLVLLFACRFKVVLGIARATQIGGGVTVAKAQCSPCGVVVGQHNVDPPQIELSPTLIERSRTNPNRFHHYSCDFRLFSSLYGVPYVWYLTLGKCKRVESTCPARDGLNLLNTMTMHE